MSKGRRRVEIETGVIDGCLFFLFLVCSINETNEINVMACGSNTTSQLSRRASSKQVRYVPKECRSFVDKNGYNTI